MVSKFLYIYIFQYTVSGQIIATSNDLTPNGGLVIKGIPFISGKSRLVKYYNLPRYYICRYVHMYDIHLYITVFYS